jgi:ArsR family transcriptional regulator
MREQVLFQAALADESRLRLLSLIRGGEICVCHLQGVLQTNQPKVSRHLAYLRRAGLVSARAEGRWTHYRLKKPPGARGEILEATLHSLRNEPRIKQDRRRLKQIVRPHPAICL